MPRQTALPPTEKDFRAEPDPGAVHEILEAILASPLFRSSRNYSAFLRFVVDRRIEGRTEDLKERSLGVDVFGRPPSYDTSADPVVRSSASEVRKRLAQFYRDPQYSRAIRIELPLGSYIPEFRLAPAEPIQVIQPVRRFQTWQLAAAGAMTILVCAAILFRLSKNETPSETFWQPILQSPGSLLVAFGRPTVASTLSVPTDSTGQHRVEAPVPAEFINYSEAYAFGKIAALLGERHRTFRIRRLGDTTVADLLDGSSILIGGPWWLRFDWTTRLTDQWRFVLQRNESRFEIVDRKNPASRGWSTDTSVPAASRTRDFALVCRVCDPKTGNLELVVAGLTGFGTTAASEFLTDPAYLDRLGKLAPPDWKEKNLQIVLSTEIINNNSTSPTIRDTYFW